MEEPVYVIDDDQRVLSSLAMLLKTADYEAHVFPSAAEFLAYMPRGGGGCIVTDLQMPDVDGVELFNQLKTRGDHLPVILITGDAQHQSAQRLVEMGIFQVLTKPFEPRLLLETVDAALRAGRGERC